MSYNVKGKITSISDSQKLDSGAEKLTFRIDTGEEFNNLLEFELYKSADHVEHIGNFIKYNKVGEDVEVEFNLRSFNWKPEADNKIFTSLSCWKVNKLGVSAEPSNQKADNQEDTDDLPF